MNILIIAPSFYPSKLGGICHALLWLAPALKRSGHHVSVLTTSRSIENANYPFNHWTTIDIESLSVCYATTRAAFVKRLLGCIRGQDVVLLNSVCFLPSTIAAIASLIYGKSVIWMPRGELFPSAIGGRLTKRAFFRVISLLLGRRVMWLATSSEEKGAIQRVIGGKASISILPNYMALPTQEQRRDAECYLLYVGRVAPIKALENVLRGLALSEQFLTTKTKFFIVGGVEKQFETYYQMLFQEISRLGLTDKVVFKGEITGREKFQIYADAYFSLLLSHSENFGNVVIEAMSQGTPVVASKGTPWQFLNDDKAGYWIGNSPSEIARCVDEILSMDASAYASFRNNAKQLSEKFDIHANISKWNNLLDSLVRQGRAKKHIGDKC